MPWLSREDLNAFWALLADNLANFVLVAGLCTGVLGLSADVVFGHVFPGLGIALFFGLGFYTWQAHQLAAREGRSDVTALPYGISTPVLFVYVFGVMLPVKLATGDGLAAWQVGLAAAAVGGMLEAGGAVLGPTLKRVTPRAGMLGTLAGIALVWIGAVPLAEIFEMPLVGFPALAIVFAGLVAGLRLPFGVPAGLAAIAVGTAIALPLGEATIDVSGAGLRVPVPVFGDLFAGFELLASHPELLAVVIPIEVYNFIETMNNVESAEAAGDAYPVATCQVADGVGTLIGASFGSPFPTTVYIGHPGYKELGGRAGYTLLSGAILGGAAFLGLVETLYHLVPIAAVAPMLVFITLVICAQAFRAVPDRHAPAVAVALLPHVSSIVVTKVASGVAAARQLAGVDGPALGDAAMVAAFAANGVHWSGQVALQQGAIVTGLIWGGMTAELIDHRPRRAAAFAAVGGVLCAIGVIHAPSLGIHLGELTLGYAVIAAVFFGLSLSDDARPGGS